MSTHSVHQFAEKVAVISDGANPIARAVALQLGLLGAFVIVGSGGDSAANSRSMEELRSIGTLAAAVNGDMATDAGAESLVGEAAKSFGRIDLLVICPEFSSPPNLSDSDGSDLETALAKTVRQAYLITRKALPIMSERPKPRIVNVVSGDKDSLKNPIFAASHAALKGFTSSLGSELPAKFRVNCVSAAFAKNTDETGGEMLFRPAGSLSPDDAARTIVFLLSSEAAAINGRFIEAG